MPPTVVPPTEIERKRCIGFGCLGQGVGCSKGFEIWSVGIWGRLRIGYKDSDGQDFRDGEMVLVDFGGLITEKGRVLGKWVSWERVAMIEPRSETDLF